MLVRARCDARKARIKPAQGARVKASALL
jgi:hypothetical protein